MTDLSELVVRIKADSSGLDRELKKATGSVTNASNQMGSSIAAVGAQFAKWIPAISAAALVGFAKNAINAAGALQDLSDRTGISSGFLSSMQITLDNAGSSVQEFANALGLMNNFIGEAANGSTGAIEALTRLGLTFEQLRTLSPEEQFRLIADGISNLGTQYEQTEAARAIFGRGAMSLLPILKDGADGIDAMTESARELNNALSEEQIKALDNAGDAWNTFVQGTKNLLAGLLADVLTLNQAIANDASKVATGSLNMARLGNYPKTASPMDQYIAKAKAGGFATQASFLSKDAYGPSQQKKVIEEVKVTTQAASKAQQDYNHQVKEYKQEIDAAARETERFSGILKDKLSGGLTEAVFAATSAGDAFKRMALSIAQSIFERNIAEPLAGGILNSVNGSGIFSSLSSLLPSFDVGSNYVPQDMMANVHKGEMIIPAAQANQMRSGGGMGGVTVQQTFTINAGVSAEVRSQVAAAAPVIASAAKDAVFAAIQSGGSAAKIVGVR